MKRKGNDEDSLPFEWLHVPCISTFTLYLIIFSFPFRFPFSAFRFQISFTLFSLPYCIYLNRLLASLGGECIPILAHGMPFQMRISSLVSFPFLPAQLARVISILFQETRSLTLHVTRPKIKTWNIHSKNWVAILYPFCSGFHL